MKNAYPEEEKLLNYSSQDRLRLAWCICKSWQQKSISRDEKIRLLKQGRTWCDYPEKLPPLSTTEEQLLDELQQQNSYVNCITDAEYPSLLAETPCPPLFLWGQGLPLSVFEKQTAIAVAGSRNASPYGLRVTTEISRYLAKQGVIVVSGLALGIDSRAHESTIQSGGLTCAVLGSGIEEVYPKSNAKLAEEIRQHGLILSEFPPLSSIRKQHFPARNRIISGLSQALIITEAGMKSGSLITASHAAEQGREVFAVPGNIYQEQSSGCLKLIAEGANLLRHKEDLLRYVAADGVEKSIEDKCSKCEVEMNEERKKNSSDPLLGLLLSEAQDSEEIAIKLGITLSQTAVLLAEYERRGLVIRRRGFFMLSQYAYDIIPMNRQTRF